MLIAGDIGGTKTALAIYSPEKGVKSPLAEKTFPSGAYGSFEELAREFLAGTDLPVRHGCFGVAGPVVGGRVKVMNLPWVMEEERLRVNLGLASVRIINDVEAVAYSVPALEDEDLVPINRGEKVEKGPIAVVAPGTGLGIAFLFRDGDRYRAHASEGGHGDFAPDGDLETGLHRFLRGKFGHVSWERVCSGMGIAHIYEYLRETGVGEDSPARIEAINAAADITPVVVDAAIGHATADRRCRRALEMFVSTLAREAGNIAMTVMATGGVYLGGGLPPRILPLLEGGRFMRPFADKGRTSEILGRMPVHVITNPAAALLGAASRGLDQLGN